MRGEHHRPVIRGEGNGLNCLPGVSVEAVFLTEYKASGVYGELDEADEAVAEPLREPPSRSAPGPGQDRMYRRRRWALDVSRSSSSRMKPADPPSRSGWSPI